MNCAKLEKSFRRIPEALSSAFFKNAVCFHMFPPTQMGVSITPHLKGASTWHCTHCGYDSQGSSVYPAHRRNPGVLAGRRVLWVLCLQPIQRSGKAKLNLPLQSLNVFFLFHAELWGSFRPGSAQVGGGESLMLAKREGQKAETEAVYFHSPV